MPINSIINKRDDFSIELIKVFAFLVILSIFTREMALGHIYGLDVDYIAYTSYILIFVIMIAHGLLSWNINLLRVLVLLLLTSLGSKYLLNISILPLLKQYLPILLIYSVVGFVVPRYGLKKSFNLYIKFATIAAIIGLVQFVIMLVTTGLNAPISNLMIDSIAEEPSHYATIVLPALVYTFINRKAELGKFIIIGLSVILTFNMTAYSVSLVCLGLIYGRSWVFLILLPVMAFLSYELYLGLPRIQLRVNSFIDYWNTSSLWNLHGTPLSFLSNLQVALNNVQINPLLGSGLGGHEETYYRYFNIAEFSRLDYLFGINAKSAHSLTIRVLSELGILGFILFLYNITKPLRISKSSVYYPIGIACFSHFLCKTLKLGNYFDLGTPFFLITIYFIYEKYRKTGVRHNSQS